MTWAPLSWSREERSRLYRHRRLKSTVLTGTSRYGSKPSVVPDRSEILPPSHDPSFGQPNETTTLDPCASIDPARPSSTTREAGHSTGSTSRRSGRRDPAGRARCSPDRAVRTITLPWTPWSTSIDSPSGKLSLAGHDACGCFVVLYKLSCTSAFRPRIILRGG